MSRNPDGLKIELIGIPVDLGQSLRGVDLGPGAIRYAGLRRKLQELGHRLIDRGNLTVPVRDSLPEEEDENYLRAITSVCELAYDAAQRAVRQGHIPVFLGGDHSIAIGTFGGVSHLEPAGLIYIDAHGDFNTPQTTPSGNVHGMSLATLVGQGFPQLVDIGRPGTKVNPEDVVLLGVRELDQRERQRLQESGITVFTMRDIDEQGANNITRQALKHLSRHKRLHVSLDLDAIDPATAPGVGTASPGGLTYREAHLMCEIIADDGRLAALDVVEINPILDHENRTALIAIELIASLFGKQII